MTAIDVTVERASLWRNRDFMLLWSGQTMSVMGSKISATAIPLLVLVMTGSPAIAGLVGFLGALPYLLVQLPAGAMVDRWNRWRTMLICDIGRLLAVVSIPIALWLNGLTITQVAIVAFLETTFYVFFELAEGAALPRIVPAESLPVALAQNEAKTRGAALAGRPLGGLLFGLDRGLPFLADAFSYLFSTVALLFMRNRDLTPQRDTPHGPIWREVAEGLRWLARHRFLRACALLVAGSNLIFQALMLAVIVLAADRGASPAIIGLILGGWGVGGLLGSFAAPWLQRFTPPKLVVIGVNWAWVALLPLLLLPGEPLLLGVVGGATAFVGPLWNVVLGSYTLMLIPDQLMGRVRSASALLALGGMPIGSLLGGLLLEWRGSVTTIWILSAMMFAVALAASISSAIRNAPPFAPVRAG